MCTSVCMCLCLFTRVYGRCGTLRRVKERCVREEGNVQYNHRKGTNTGIPYEPHALVVCECQNTGAASQILALTLPFVGVTLSGAATVVVTVD